METWLKESQPDYLENQDRYGWSIIKYNFIQRLLGLGKTGSAIRGHAHFAPNEELATALLNIYQLIDRSVYFTSQYWRAFYYWLKHQKLNPCWPQFGEREAQLAYSVLTVEDLAYLYEEANKEWADDYATDSLVTDLISKIQRPVYRLCYKRAGFLQDYDPALYSLADINQYAMESVLLSIRNNDHLNRSLDWLTRWSVKCADNALHNLVKLATRQKRNRALDDNEDYRDELYRQREFYLSTNSSSSFCDGGEDREASADLMNSLRLLGNQPFKEMEEIEDNCCLKELLRLADPKIHSYLMTVCGGEHNPDFWSWFYYNEPTLAQRLAYIEENPEALGPFVQRHLGLPTHQLTGFLRQHLPSLLDRVHIKASPANKAQLIYGT
jgi:hypothetical protein